jgi:hypothetical protein
MLRRNMEYVSLCAIAIDAAKNDLQAPKGCVGFSIVS